MKRLHFFVDFDGTISSTDVVDIVLERFAGPEWQAIEREWAAGRIGSRECLSRQVALVRADEAALDALVAGVGVDPGFAGFLRAASELEVPVSVVSDGFDLFIRRILADALPDAALREALPVFSNRLEWRAGRLEASFAGGLPGCEHGCANCKPAVMRREGAGDFTIFVGDGLSDRFAAHEADMVFAKGKLLTYCVSKGVRHRVYTGFDEIERWLRECAAGQRAYKTLHG